MTGSKENDRQAEPIFVTRPSLPSLEAFTESLRQIWDTKMLTNAGPFHQELEHRLGEYLGVEHVSLVNNGTVALIIALQFLERRGEVITTPYSFVATTNALIWTGFTPVFVDIDPMTCNLDPARIEAAITADTVAILPVHCYGNPADVEAIQAIADRHDLHVIYDAAHAFGVRDNGKSILGCGDLSTLSFHATKVFNTFEGGAIISRDAAAKTRIGHLRNFGFVDEVTVVTSGMNGKMSEINAAFGLLQLKHVSEEIEKRRIVSEYYRQALDGVQGVDCLAVADSVAGNYGYFPIFVKADFRIGRDELYDLLKSNGIYSRRYFYPLISSFPMYRDLPSARPANLGHAIRIANEVLCLPIYADLDLETVDKIVDLIENG
ncbi:DegT/DnrJ/EryC1/StrS family aminotransferase [Sphingosinicella rhizophila]|uniref:DegT/DnrJ/EryC1/StrS family aminotransferase n=1 Tax=Sphingosinicella rhizophila TaxID=3050082 RepID=A0ABU3Q6G2_9SPHN|nr:DegT/DnrJ/EryC1/StrS family aminotransferase [Sphingosinicella sp. GR2756]MDT9598892.1 DegT/DnrJ/EryC1/StrS family aminotransferase [Sphingosinicella sp. GR2756]